MQIFYPLKDYFIQFILCILIGYILGSISFSVLITKIFGKKDVRKMGSGNAGFTNVLRCAGFVPSVITLFLDLLKCIIAIHLSTVIFNLLTFNGMYNPVVLQSCKYITGIFCIMGHIYPCFFQFKGGKGVVTTAGAMIMIDWRVFLLAIGVFLIVLAITKIVSLSSIIAASSMPIIMFLITFFIDYLPNINNHSDKFTLTYVIISTLFSLIIALLIVFKHKSNIERLKKGEEKKITVKK